MYTYVILIMPTTSYVLLHFYVTLWSYSERRKLLRAPGAACLPTGRIPSQDASSKSK